MPQDALQTLVDNGLDKNKLRAICDDIVACDEDMRWAALLAYLIDNGNTIDPDEIEEAGWGDYTFSVGRATYKVLTDSEADDAAREYIEDSLWAFSASFLSCKTGLPEDVFTALADKCEGANDTFRTIIDGSCGIDDLVEDAIRSDGRGHFLNTYDGSEDDVSVGGEDFVVVRIN